MRKAEYPPRARETQITVAVNTDDAGASQICMHTHVVYLVEQICPPCHLDERTYFQKQLILD